MQLRTLPGVIQNPFDQRSDELGELLRKWVTKRSVCNDLSALKEGGDAGSFGAVYDVIGDDEISGANLLTQRSYRVKCQNRFHTNVLKRGDIGSKRDI